MKHEIKENSRSYNTKDGMVCSEPECEINFNNMTESKIKKICFLQLLEIAKNDMIKEVHKKDQPKRINKYKKIKENYTESYCDDTINDIRSAFDY